jgi:MFS family permease
VGPVSGALRYQLGWGDDPSTIDMYTTIMATSSIIGICIGSLIGGDIIKNGRRFTILRFNIIGLIASLSMFTLNFYVMCFGRVIFGLSSGVLLCATPKMIDETVPAKLLDKGFGASTAIIMCLF